MELTVQVSPKELVVVMRGRFDAHETAGFRNAVPHPSAGVVTVVNLADVVFIDSTALAELVRLSRSCTAAGTTLLLRAPSTPVRVILELTGLDKALRVEPDHAAVPS